MDFHSEIEEDGYHIFSIEKAKITGFYPNRFPDYPGVKLTELSIGDRITIRAFFPVGPGEPIQIDGGYIDLEIEHVDSDHVFGEIQTELPKEFALSNGDSLEIREDEILYKVEQQEH
ncbi:MAG: hypothetical protein ABFS18_02825 [Thermodesulfobacteriota bacterium]